MQNLMVYYTIMRDSLAQGLPNSVHELTFYNQADKTSC